jgi:hypothetical protein
VPCAEQLPAPALRLPAFAPCIELVTPLHLNAPPTPAGAVQALGIDTIALMFLTTGPIPHERTWRLWLEGAAGWLPYQGLEAAKVGRRHLPLPAAWNRPA